MTYQGSTFRRLLFLRLMVVALSAILLSGGLTALFMLAGTGSVAQAADHDCLAIGKYASTGTLDLENGLYIEEINAARPYLKSPDGRFDFYQQYGDNAITLSVGPAGSSQYKPIVKLPLGAYLGDRRFSPDGSVLIFGISTDNHHQFGVVNADGSNFFTMDMPGSPNGTSVGGPNFDGWSADSRYFTYHNWEDANGVNRWLQHVVDIVGRRVLTLPGEYDFSGPFQVASHWSNTGHTLAVLQLPAGTLILYSPDSGEALTMPLPASLTVPQFIVWSPDDAYVAVTGRVNCADPYDNTCMQGAAIYPRNGGPAQEVIGKPYQPIQDPPRWSGDARRWLVTRSAPDGTNDLVAYGLGEKAEQIIERGVVDVWRDEFIWLQTGYIAPDQQRMLIVTQQDGKYGVVLSDLDGGQRVTLVEGADSLEPARFPQYTINPIWVGDQALVVWRRGNQHGLTWARADGTERREIIVGEQAIQDLAPVAGDRFVTYLLADLTLWMADLHNGQTWQVASRSQPDPQTAQNTNWRTIVSPDGQRFALSVGYSPRRLLLGEFANVGKTAREIASEYYSVVWSPDGSRLAYTTLPYNPMTESYNPIHVFVLNMADGATQEFLAGNIATTRPKGFSLMDDYLEWMRCELSPDDMRRPTITPTYAPTQTPRPNPTAAPGDTAFACLAFYSQWYDVRTGEKTHVPSEEQVRLWEGEVGPTQPNENWAGHSRPAAAWAVYDDQVAFMDYFTTWTSRSAWLTLQAPGTRRVFLVSDKAPTPEFAWQRGYPLPNPQLVWSPDGRFLLVQWLVEGDTPNSWQIRAYGLDGSALNLTAAGRAVWLDGHTLYFPTANGPTITDTVTGQAEPFVPGSRHVPNMPGADDQGDPYWSPDSKRVALVWAIGQGSQRIVRLSWANADGSGLQTLEDGLSDVRDLHWLRDGSTLFYVTQRAQSFSVESLDTRTGQRRVVLDGLSSVSAPERHPTKEAVSFWWRDQAGHVGRGTYTATGQKVSEVTLDSVASFAALDGLEIFPDAYRWIKFREVFRSPDGRAFALLLPPQNWAEHWRDNLKSGELSVVLVAADGSWLKVLRTRGKKIDHLRWSPDGTLFAFIQQTGTRLSVDVVRADGLDVAYIERDKISPSSYPNFAWARCP